MSKLLDNLDALFQEAKDNTPTYLEQSGTYEAELVSVKLDAQNKWSDGTLVPKVSLAFKVLEGAEKDKVFYINLNLGGREKKNIEVALSVFVGTAKKLGVDVTGLDIKSTIKAMGDKIGGKYTVEVTFDEKGYSKTKVK